MKTGNGGFTLIGLLALMMVIGLMTMAVGQTWSSIRKAEREKDLLWTGNQYRIAIRNYMRWTKNNLPAGHPIVPPSSIDDLLKDPRSAGNRRFLRKKYKDPMTGKDDWVLILDGQQKIKGVHSNCDDSTQKRDNFDVDDEMFKGKTKYSEWVFDYDPNKDPFFGGAQALGQQPVTTTSTGADKPFGDTGDGH